MICGDDLCPMVQKLTSRHFRQNVCWQGSTFDVVSNRSKHTEHSSRSLSVCSSIANRSNDSTIAYLCAYIEIGITGVCKIFAANIAFCHRLDCLYLYSSSLNNQFPKYYCNCKYEWIAEHRILFCFQYMCFSTIISLLWSVFVLVLCQLLTEFLSIRLT